MSPAEPPLPRITSSSDIAAQNQQRVEAIGIYRAIPAPRKDPSPTDAPKTHAFLELKGGERLYLEAFGVPQATRPQDELQRFDGHPVRAVGIVHKIMPSPRAGLVAPSLSQVESVALMNG